MEKGSGSKWRLKYPILLLILKSTTSRFSIYKKKESIYYTHMCFGNIQHMGVF